jgi:alkylated DNA repair dioxygenase AlkB
LLQRTILDLSAVAGQSRRSRRAQIVRAVAADARLRCMVNASLGPHRHGIELDLFEGEARLWPEAFTPLEAQQLFVELREGVHWQQESVLIFGQRRLVPRLVAWHGDAGASYVYSGADHEPEPWTPTLARIRERVCELVGIEFNAVLLNLYRDGRDGMGWHADDEPELGRDPVIGSVSLGATRRFCMRHRRRKDLKLELPLQAGSLLCMSGATQHHWLHAVPKTRLPVGARVNLTFRRVSLT